jgi:hypothetical protein
LRINVDTLTDSSPASRICAAASVKMRSRVRAFAAWL